MPAAPFDSLRGERYATDSRNMFEYFLRNSTRYFFVPIEGR